MTTRDPGVEAFLSSVRDALAECDLGNSGRAAIDRIFGALDAPGSSGSGRTQTMPVCGRCLPDAYANARRHSPAMERIVEAFRASYPEADVRIEYLHPTRVIERVLSDDAEQQMPPPKSNRRVSAAQIAVIRRWIADGEAYQRHWAFETPRRPAVRLRRGWRGRLHSRASSARRSSPC